MKTGIFLLNLGTPSGCDVSSVRRYLAEFLMDPYVVDIPYLARWLLVHGLILRTRPARSAEAYQSIWTDKGSPLLVYSQALLEAVSDKLSASYQVALGMRYGQPSIATAAKSLLNCDEICVLPLFPQYSLAATESALVKAKQELQCLGFKGPLRQIRSFYDNEHFIAANVTLLKKYFDPDSHLLFSYHGLPVKQIHKVSDCRSACDAVDTCPLVQDFNADCYRAQSYATSHLIATNLGLSSGQYSVSFQSRLGKLPWIKPYTDELLPTLYAKGIRNLSVVCPSFVVDCLETLEEIGMQANEQWSSLGGEQFSLLPCLNSADFWVDALVEMIMGSA